MNFKKCPFEHFYFDKNYVVNDKYFMQLAFNNAIDAWNNGEIPIGAVGVIDNKVVSNAFNCVEKNKDATAHAEVEIIRSVSKQICDWRLTDLTLYVTKEPCPMCAGAIFKSRIKRVVIGARDNFQGCFGSCLNFNSLRLYHNVIFSFENLDGLCEKLLNGFFKMRRDGC